jgi:chromosome segregation ATPase
MKDVGRLTRQVDGEAKRGQTALERCASLECEVTTLKLALVAQSGELAKMNTKNVEMEKDLTRMRVDLAEKCAEVSKLNARLSHWRELDTKRQRTRKARLAELKAERDAAIHVCTKSLNTPVSFSIMFFVFPTGFE